MSFWVEIIPWKGIYHAKLSQSNPAQGGAAALQQFTVQTFLGSSRISSQNISISLLRDFHWLPSVVIQLPAQLLLRLCQPVHVQGYFLRSVDTLEMLENSLILKKDDFRALLGAGMHVTIFFRLPCASFVTKKNIGHFQTFSHLQ